MYIRLVALSRGYSHSTKRGFGLVQLRFFPHTFRWFHEHTEDFKRLRIER